MSEQRGHYERVTDADREAAGEVARAYFGSLARDREPTVLTDRIAEVRAAARAEGRAELVAQIEALIRDADRFPPRAGRHRIAVGNLRALIGSDR